MHTCAVAAKAAEVVVGTLVADTLRVGTCARAAAIPCEEAVRKPAAAAVAGVEAVEGVDGVVVVVVVALVVAAALVAVVVEMAEVVATAEGAAE